MDIMIMPSAGEFLKSYKDAGVACCAFMPFTCDYDVGEQFWRLQLIDNTDYKDTNLSGNMNVTLETYLNGSINQPDYQIYRREPYNNVTFNMTVWDDCGYVDSPASLLLEIDEPGPAPPMHGQAQAKGTP